MPKISNDSLLHRELAFSNWVERKTSDEHISSAKVIKWWYPNSSTTCSPCRVFWTMHQSGKTRTITQAPQTQKHLWYPLWHGLQVILYGLLLRIHTVHQQPVAISAVLKVNSTVKTVSGPGQLQCPKRYFKTFHAISSCSSPRHWT
jgi:hypothetical protein